MVLDFYKGKKVLLTGHTGFKGTWLTKILLLAGADVLGYARCSKKDPSLFALSGVEKQIIHVKGDVRDYGSLLRAFQDFQPEIVFHLAAQPIVRESYLNPRETYETNVMGTVNVLECIRQTDSVRSVVIVTTDKVYRNDETAKSFGEDDILDGFDPYSNSKSCAELVTATYKRSFPALPPISTARAGNVLGGGDFAKDRIIPDCVRAMQKGKPIIIRKPFSIRPWQHVLEPLSAYLLIAQKQYDKPEFAGAYNIGPVDDDCVAIEKLVSIFCEKWGDYAKWICECETDAPHEAGFLKLDSSLIETMLGWKPKWHIDECMEKTVRFSRKWLSSGEVQGEMDTEIAEYFEI